MTEIFLEEMINKINQITSSLDGTIAQIQNMNNAIQQMSMKFSEATVSLSQSIGAIVEFLQQFRIISTESIKELSDELKDKIRELWDKKSLEAILEQEKVVIDMIKHSEKAVSNNLYYAQLLKIIESIKEETNRIISCGRRV